MPKFRFNKLVRDKIIDHQIASGAKPNYRLLKLDEHIRELINKVIEEAQEISTAKPKEVAAEIADVQQALDDLKAMYKITDDGVDRAQKLKISQNGAFKKGYYIEYIELSEDDKWVKYYRGNSDRYPEIKQSI